MPVPLNAAVEVTRTWLSKRLGYLVDDSIPVRPSKESVKATTPMDIDLICTHPRLNRVEFTLGGHDFDLPRALIKEEISEKGKTLFGGIGFARVLVCPHLQSKLKRRDGSTIAKKELLERAQEKGIYIIELRHLLEDLIRFCESDDAKDQRRRNFVLEIIHLLAVAKLVKPRSPML